MYEILKQLLLQSSRKKEGGKTHFVEYIKIDRDKSTFKSHRDFDSEIEMTFKHF